MINVVFSTIFNEVSNFDIHAQIKVTDAEGKEVSFRKLLLNRCQREFEKEKEDEQAMSEKLTQLEELSVGTNSCNFVEV